MIEFALRARLSFRIQAAPGTLALISIVAGHCQRLVGAAIALLVLGVAFAAGPVHGQQVVDGDTLKLQGVTYRLWGIDAPEIKQDCPDGWAAGRLAATHLQSLISRRSVICERKDTDRYGRTVAICRAGGEDLGSMMVRDGYAWAFLRYSADYAGQETLAKRDGVGVHRHDCVPAWEWRAKQRSSG